MWGREVRSKLALATQGSGNPMQDLRPFQVYGTQCQGEGMPEYALYK
jgi:hypothetical protein